ncbi:hypothetical protein LV779_02475 [Streptomyces thinghirensis]|nr:hypothetical protein [Streptomyces thinghirensis]
MKTGQELGWRVPHPPQGRRHPACGVPQHAPPGRPGDVYALGLAVDRSTVRPAGARRGAVHAGDQGSPRSDWPSSTPI